MRAQGGAGTSHLAHARRHESEAAAGGHNERAPAQVERAAGEQEQKQKHYRRQLASVTTSSKTRERAARRGRQSSANYRRRPASVRMSPGAPDNSSGPQMGGAETGARISEPQLEQFTQVPQQFSQTPHSFSGAISHSNAPANPSAPFLHQTMPADLSVAAPIGRQASGPMGERAGPLQLAAAFDQSATHHQLGNMMAAAARQQDLLSQFTSLHGLSAVASAMQHQHLQSQSKPQEFALGAFASTSHLGAASQQQFQSLGEPAPRKPPGRRRRGARKCRKVYGMAQRPLWCTQCKWKKACSRFSAAASVQQGEPVSTTTDFSRRPAGAKTRAPPIDYQMAAAAAAAANGSHLIRNLLDMSASFQRLQAAVTQPNFRSNAQV